jgi:hypothetical protein
MCTLKCCYQEKVFGNLGFLLHVLIIGASLAFRGIHICFYIYHIDSTQRQDTLEKEVGKDTHGYISQDIYESFLETLVSCFMYSS